ncbi:hypothetical protein QSH57_006904 [Fusarium oxysporum f. sp. vasinfectum]|nr:hypothetical protein QSH57_006904 [Fusarium oxysporum f. sp. vasinfectum]
MTSFSNIAIAHTMPHNILLTGASGYLGGDLLAELASTDLPEYGRLFALIRSSEQADAVKQLGAEPLTLDVYNEDAVREAVLSHEITVVFFLINAVSSASQKLFIKALSELKKKTGSDVHFLHTTGAKMFSSHSGAPTDRELSDNDPELFAVQKAQRAPLMRFQEALDTNNTIIELSEASQVKSYIFAPCIVYGKGRGFGNPISIQTVAIVQAAKALRRVYRTDAGDPIWPVSHIADNTNLYVQILRTILIGQDPGHGKLGYYLASSGSVQWNDIYNAFGKALAQRGVIDDATVQDADDEILQKMADALNCPKDFVAPQLGGTLLDRLLQENEELRAQIHPESPQPRNTDVPWQPAPTSNDHQDAAEEKILEEIDWFAHTRTSDTPIWIGEISDAAFATRFRQFASSSQTPSHIPRTQFASDDDLRLLVTTNPAWPTPPRARLLVQTALKFLRCSYHVVRRSEILSALNTFCLDPSNAGVRPIMKSKMWALFALGELRSSKCLSSSKRLPGLAYFAVASDTVRMINERPQLDVIETTLILTLYSLEANRRHSACTLVGSAMRLATVMGLHLNIGDTYLADPELREHRIRVWWSVYILDRLLSSKIGLPLLISDEDISVDLPSNSPALTSEDFGDHSHFLAIVRLAKIAGNISRSLYVRTPQRGTFLQRVARIREELDHWKGELPDQVKADFSRTDETEDYSQFAISRLKVSFNQLFILATRPALLFCFRRQVDEAAAASRENPLPDAAREAADACVSAARQSCQMLLRSWVNGEFHTFDYSYVQHLFSAAVILAIASTLGQDTSKNDREEFEIVAGFLRQLEENGNPAAMEFYAHIKEIQIVLEAWRSTPCQPNALPISQDLGSTEVFQRAMVNQPLEVPVLHNTELGTQAADGSPLNLSFLDDWIYDNAFQQICWQE